MNYITDERKMIQQMARDFALEQVLPIANKLDPEQGEIPMSLRDKMAELGYFGILIPEEYGGLGLGAFEYALVTEELARAWMSVASIIARGNSLGAALPKRTSAATFRKIARGEWLGAFSLSEPDAGSDLANVACKATRAGDEWVITGTKTWCTFAEGADFISAVRAHFDRRPVPSAATSAQPVPGPKGARHFPARDNRIADSQDRLLRLENLRAPVRQTFICRPRRCSARKAAASTR